MYQKTHTEGLYSYFNCSEVTINTSSLSNGDAKRKSIFGISRIPATTTEPKKLSKFDQLLNQDNSNNMNKNNLENKNNKKEEEENQNKTTTTSIKTVKTVTKNLDNTDDDENIKNNDMDTSDSEYETEEVYELREWYPPDFWRAKDQDSANRVCQTDVTANNLTVTMLESRVCDGFFKAL